MSFLFSPSLLYASLPVVLSLFLRFLFPFPLFSLPSLPCPCSILPLFLSLLSSLLLCPLLLSPALLISLPQHPVPSLWCVLVLAKARPGRTDGYLVRQRSPWAPTPFPPPGAAQVSRWKVRGERSGKEVLGLKPGLGVLLAWHSGSGREKRDSLQGSPVWVPQVRWGMGLLFSEYRLGRSGAMSNGTGCPVGVGLTCS